MPTSFGFSYLDVADWESGLTTPGGRYRPRASAKSTRFMKTMNAADGPTRMMLTTHCKLRGDGEPNEHRMFRVEYLLWPKRFLLLARPWSLGPTHHSPISRYSIVDIGLDYIIKCKKQRFAFILLHDSTNRLDMHESG